MRRQGHARLGWLALLAAGLAAAAMLVTAVAASADPDRTPSRRPTPWRHGALLSARAVGAPRGARAWRILYRSTTGAGKWVTVSGLIVVPTGRAPKHSRNVVARAHGTTGLTQECGPSVVPNPARNLLNYFTFKSPFGFDVGVPALTRFLQAGDVVVATDYQGLGTSGSGLHQYTVAATLAHNVLDSVKAADGLWSAHAGRRAVVLGWSEGGGASLWTGQDVPYGKPVRVLGTAALAPNADIYNEVIGAVLPGPTDATAPSHEAALEMSLYMGLKAAYPNLKLSDVLTRTGVSQARGLAHQCIEHFANNVLQTSVNNGWGLDPSRHLFTFPPPRAWTQTIKVNTPGYSTGHAPILVMQGLADTVINPNATTQYIKRACRFRQRVQYTTYPGQTHQTIPSAAQNQYVHWIAARFAGQRAPENCA